MSTEVGMSWRPVCGLREGGLVDKWQEKDILGSDEDSVNCKVAKSQDFPNFQMIKTSDCLARVPDSQGPR